MRRNTRSCSHGLCNKQYDDEKLARKKWETLVESQTQALHHKNAEIQASQVRHATASAELVSAHQAMARLDTQYHDATLYRDRLSLSFKASHTNNAKLTTELALLKEQLSVFQDECRSQFSLYQIF